MTYSNSYEDTGRAEAYAELEFPGTYYLACRDLPDIMQRHLKGREALDFGCGTGRSTRFLVKLGFNTIGVDIAPEMLVKARQLDLCGDYRLVRDGDLSSLPDRTFNLVLSVFTFDNIPTMPKKVTLFEQLKNKLTDNGRLISLVSSPEIYVNEWASFTTKDFPENRKAGSGDKVKIIMTDVADSRPVEDTIWSHEDYLRVYEQTGLKVSAIYKPLARDDEPFRWVSETKIAPWTIYVLKEL